MYIANVYKIMIAAPSDISDEIQIAKNVINRWNTINSEPRRCVLLPLHWSDNAYPVTGKHPQKTIDEILVKKSDLLICIFGSRLGSPTDTHESGSIEEIEEHLKTGKNVMIFFKKIGKTPNTDGEIQQMQQLLDYKKSIQDKALWYDYQDENSFESVIRDKLELYVNGNWLNSNKEEKTVAEEGETLSLNKTEITIPCGSFGYIDIIGVKPDMCDLNIQDGRIGYAIEEDSRIKIDGRKVGETKLKVSYKDLKAECTIKITPMNMFCGNPILDFGKDMDYIKEKCKDLPHNQEIEKSIINCQERIGNFQIIHRYIFQENKLIFVVSRISCLNPKDKNNLFINALNCMNERYDNINSDTKIMWYQYKDDFYITSVNFSNQGEWLFCYTPTKEIMDQKLKSLI